MNPSRDRIVARFLEARGVAAKAGELVEKGDLVRLKTNRKGWIEGQVSDVTNNWRARKYPWIFKVVSIDGSGDYNWKSGSNRYDAPSNERVFKFISKSKLTKNIDESNKRRQDRATQKEDSKAEMVKVLRTFNLEPGDKIKFGYRSPYGGTDNKIETVAGVNYRTGKVGIERFTPAQKRDYQQRVQDKKDRNEWLRAMGLNTRGGTDRSVRWLRSTGIVEVVERIK